MASAATAFVTESLLEFIEQSKDGYGIYDGDDQLVFSNDAFRDIFAIDYEQSLNLDFSSIIAEAYQRKRGVNIETEDIEDWITYANRKRRSLPFRTFEVDMLDGRWFLITEQTCKGGIMLVQAKDITRQKVLEGELKNSVKLLNQLALTDELTQIANRRCFVESVENELSRCHRFEGTVTLMLVDLDHFKGINDNFGHHAGDIALKRVASTLKTLVRQYDIIGRIGGEEFAVFLGNSCPALAKRVAERIRSEVESITIQYAGKELTLTTSVGLTTSPCSANFESLFLQADKALYQAKEKGRNRVISYAA